MSNPYNGNGCGYDGCGYGIGVPAPNAAVPLLLDDLAATYGAWSVARKIRTAYNGPLIRVRESGGNTEADINAANGVLDETALASHCGANSGYITKIYNQDATGSTLDFTQSTTTIQPIIVESGTIVKENGKPAAKFVAAASRQMSVPSSTALFNFLHNGTTCVVSFVTKCNDNAALKVLFSKNVNSTGANATFQFSTTEVYQILLHNGSANPIVSTKGSGETSQIILTTKLDASNATAASREASWKNGALLSGSNAQTSAVSTSNSSANATLGAFSGGNSAWDGTIQELIIWPTDETASRTTWEADIADFYGVTLA